MYNIKKGVKTPFLMLLNLLYNRSSQGEIYFLLTKNLFINIWFNCVVIRKEKVYFAVFELEYDFNFTYTFA
jgi:hypothetical protein